MKKWKKVLFIILVGLLVLGLAKNILIELAVENGARAVLGTPVRIQSLAVGIFRPRVEIKGFKMYNPAEFPKGVMVDIPHIRVEYDLQAILRGNLHLPEITLDMKKVVIYKNKAGELNVDALKVAQKKQPDQQKAPKKEESSRPLRMQLDEVNLNLGQVVVKDYSVDGPVEVLAYDIGIKNKTYRDINSPQALATIVLTQAMAPTALRSAALYAAATALGVAFLPAGVAGVMLGKDSAEDVFDLPASKVYDQAFTFLSEMGEITVRQPNAGILKGNVRGAEITLSVTDLGQGQTKVIITARKMLLPKAEIAQGLLYQLSEDMGQR